MRRRSTSAGPSRTSTPGSTAAPIDNPINALATIIAALKGPDGRIRIPGFYDDVVALTEADRAALARLPFDDEAYRAALDVPALAGETGWTTLERRGARPTLDVNGIWGGFAGRGQQDDHPRPGPRQDHAAGSSPTRTPTGSSPCCATTSLAIAPPGVRVDVVSLGGGRPLLAPTDHPATRAFARALEETFGRPPLFVREGGSIPVAASFASIVGLPVTVMGFMPPNGNFHAPNEWMDLANFESGIRTLVRFFEIYATAGPLIGGVDAGLGMVLR